MWCGSGSTTLSGPSKLPEAGSGFFEIFYSDSEYILPYQVASSNINCAVYSVYITSAIGYSSSDYNGEVSPVTMTTNELSPNIII